MKGIVKMNFTGMIDIINNIQKNRLKKVVKKSAKATMKKSIVISDWCKAYGNLDRYNWIINELFKEVDADKDLELEEYILLTEDLEVALDEDGVFIFSEVLIKFFGEKEVMGMHFALRNSNRLVTEIYDPITAVIKDGTLSNGDLLKAYNNWKEWFKNNQETLNTLDEDNKNILTLTFENITKEVKRRKLL